MDQNLRVLNIRQDFKDSGYCYEPLDMNIRKEFQDQLILYERKKDNTLIIYLYNKYTGDIDLIAKLNHISNANEEYIHIDLITESDIYYTLAGKERLTFYRYNIHGRYREIIFEGAYSFSMFLDKRYVLLTTHWDEDMDYDLYLYDMKEKQKYLIYDEFLKKTDYIETRKVRLDESFYLIHNKQLYDINYMDRQIKNYDKIPGKYKSGIHIIHYEKFIRDVKRGVKYLDWDYNYFSNNINYVKSVEYGDIFPKFISENNYHFTDINLKEKYIDLYEVSVNIEKGIHSDLLERLYYADYEDSNNLIIKNYPVQICKYTEFDYCEELNLLYPENFKLLFQNDDGERLLSILDDYIITFRWEEEKLDNGDLDYKEHIRVRDRKTLRLLKEKEGIGSVLSDNKTLVII